MYSLLNHFCQNFSSQAKPGTLLKGPHGVSLHRGHSSTWATGRARRVWAPAAPPWAPARLQRRRRRRRPSGSVGESAAFRRVPPATGHDGRRERGAGCMACVCTLCHLEAGAPCAVPAPASRQRAKGAPDSGQHRHRAASRRAPPPTGPLRRASTSWVGQRWA